MPTDPRVRRRAGGRRGHRTAQPDDRAPRPLVAAGWWAPYTPDRRASALLPQQELHLHGGRFRRRRRTAAPGRPGDLRTSPSSRPRSPTRAAAPCWSGSRVHGQRGPRRDPDQAFALDPDEPVRGFLLLAAGPRSGHGLRLQPACYVHPRGDRPAGDRPVADGLSAAPAVRCRWASPDGLAAVPGRP